MAYSSVSSNIQIFLFRYLEILVFFKLIFKEHFDLCLCLPLFAFFISFFFINQLLLNPILLHLHPFIASPHTFQAITSRSKNLILGPRYLNASNIHPSIYILLPRMPAQNNHQCGPTRQKDIMISTPKIYWKAKSHRPNFSSIKINFFAWTDLFTTDGRLWIAHWKVKNLVENSSTHAYYPQNWMITRFNQILTLSSHQWPKTPPLSFLWSEFWY